MTPLCNLGAEETGGERVKVYVRVRPTKTNHGETPGALRLGHDGKAVLARREGYAPAQFCFDGVLGSTASQGEVYEAAASQAVVDVLNGFNATVLAYGQTGAGKTHTLSNIQPQAVGLIPRAISEIFQAIARCPPMCSYSVSMSYLQIYCEMIQDLLHPEAGDNLPIRELADGTVKVQGLRQVQIKSVEECLSMLQLGNRNRTVAFTALNAHSSRSHAVLMIRVEQSRDITENVESLPNSSRQRRIRVGTLFMVDLAGSERLKKSKSIGQRATEAKSINLSLTTLGMCVNARASNTKVHVPFRDSKLTRLLQDSLGGNARTSLVVAVSDAVEHADETVQSLMFGSRAMRVVTHAQVNERLTGGPNSNWKEVQSIEDATSALSKTLLLKENELEAALKRLQEQEEQSRKVVEALRLEQMETEARAAALETRHAEAFERLLSQGAERERLLLARAQRAEGKVTEMEANYKSEVERVQAQYAKELSEKQKEIAVLVSQRDKEHAEALEAAHRKAEAASKEAQLLTGQVQELAGRLKVAKRKIHEAEKAAVAARRAHSDLLSSLARNRQVNAAATTIQRAYRAYRVKKLERAQTNGVLALSEARSALGSLAVQHAELEARRASNLVFAGQTLLGESVGALQQTVEELLAAFLLPHRDLKAVQKYKEGSRKGVHPINNGVSRAEFQIPALHSLSSVDMSSHLQFEHQRYQ